MAVDRRDPEFLLIRQQEQAARPRSPKPQHRWPASEFVPPPRSGPRSATRFIDLTREALPEPPRESPLRFVTRAAVEGTQKPARGLSPPAASPRAIAFEPQMASSTAQSSGKGHATMLTGKSIKIVVPLVPSELLSLGVKDGVPRVLLRIEVAGRVLMADVSAKSLRKAIRTVAEFGADGVTALVQGKLVGDCIEECGLVAQPKTPKPGAEAA